MTEFNVGEEFKRNKERLDSKLEAAKAELSEIEEQLSSVKKQRIEMLSRLKEFDALKSIDDFIANKPMFFVRTCGSEIRLFTHEHDVEIKLLTLFGGSKGNFNWRLNQYYDGNGNDYLVYPFSSEKEAIDFAKKICLEEIVEYASNGSSYIPSSLLYFADKYGVEIPEDIAKQIKRIKLAGLKKKRDELESQTYRINNLIAEVENE